MSYRKQVYKQRNIISQKFNGKTENSTVIFRILISQKKHVVFFLLVNLVGKTIDKFCIDSGSGPPMNRMSIEEIPA